jgi:ribokinase
VEVADTTGAGDAFAAGFIADHLRGEAIEAALAAANACGAIAARSLGARSELDPEAVDRLRER